MKIQFIKPLENNSCITIPLPQSKYLAFGTENSINCLLFVENEKNNVSFLHSDP